MSSPKIPFLPGNQFSDPQKTEFHKNQTLVYKHDTRHDNFPLKADECDYTEYLTTEIPNNHTTRELPSTEERKYFQESLKNTYRPRIQPAWLKYDKQVLRFFAFYQESIPECPTENYRIRHCIILYYLEDNTVQINEPKIENSALPQSTILQRHTPINPCTNQPFQIHEFSRGNRVHLYAKEYTILDFDAFTEWYFQTNSIPVGTPLPPPQDPFFQQQVVPRLAQHAPKVNPESVIQDRIFAEAMLGRVSRKSGLEQFLNNDNKVLRFQIYTQDKLHYGGRVYYTLLYFLSDDTVQIAEAHREDSGKVHFPLFLKRMRLPRSFQVEAVPGLQPLPLKKDYYLASDFVVGGDLTFFSRTFHIYDCDDFTRRFYREFMGIEQGCEALESASVTVPRLSYPPYDGLGVEEDTLQNIRHLLPTAPLKDFKKLDALSGVVLRFQARMVDGGEGRERRDGREGRKFVVSCTPANDYVGCWEMKVRNSGFVEGKFAELGLKRKEGKERKGKDSVMQKDNYDPHYYNSLDLYVGARVYLSGVHFVLESVDLYTANFMSKHNEMYLAENPMVLCNLFKGVWTELGGVSEISPMELWEKVKGREEIVLHHVLALVRLGGGVLCSKGAIGPDGVPPLSLKDCVAYNTMLDVNKCKSYQPTY